MAGLTRPATRNVSSGPPDGLPKMASRTVVVVKVMVLAVLLTWASAGAWVPRAVAGALLVLGSAPALAPTLGAGGSTAAARVRRLIAVAALSAFPLVLLAAPACCLFGAGYL
jgi:uncharacterized membrane protein